MRSWFTVDREAGRGVSDAAADGCDDGRRVRSTGDAASSNAPASAVERRGGRLRWYAVQTHAFSEARAGAHLGNQGFRIFLPLYLRTRRHARRIDTVRVPLFPCYLFVRLDLTRDRWRSVNGTVGVVRLVMAGGTPQPVPVGVVEHLAAATDDKGIVRFDADLRRGQSVRVTAGPFAELMGVLERLDDAGRARVLLEIMGGRVAVSLSRQTIIPAAG